MRRWLHRFVATTLATASDDQRRWLAETAGRPVDWEPSLVLISVAIALTVQNYAVFENAVSDFLFVLMGQLPSAKDIEPPAEFLRLTRWTLGQLLAYVVVPLIVLKLILKRPLADYGVKRNGATSLWWIYAGMYLFIFPAVLLVSTRASFLHTYPFYRLHFDEPLWPWFFVWELMYAVQFVALEFFFRGYLVHGTKRRLGPSCILVMTIPYCMIHFGKPLPETLGAIAAGVVLGFMSLKTGSIWMGAALHIAVAWTMDTLALWQHAS